MRFVFLLFVGMVLCSSFVLGVCGDGFVEPSEDCDGGPSGVLGCTPDCRYDSYYVCEGEPSVCTHLGDVYGWFNNFSLHHFGAETEELIYERQGQVLEFVSSGDWVHSSENSASIAFETNLPSKSYVEWGSIPGNYDLGRTYVHERYFYLHLHYMTGLEQDTTYYYRIVSRDERGNIIYSDERTLTTITYPNKIEISTDGPHELDQQGMVYVLKSDIRSDTKGFTIRHNDITIDLNGFTLTYDDGEPLVPEGLAWNDYFYNDLNATFGINTRNYGTRDNFLIVNGRIVQGSNQGQGTIGIGFNPLQLKGDGYEVAGITILFNGNNTHGISTHSRGHIHHNSITAMSADFVVDRHQGVRSITSHEGFNHHNLVKRAYHQIFSGSGDVVFSNEGYADSYDTNSFLLAPRVGAHAYDNKLFGTGYMVMAISWSRNIIIEDNLVYLHGFMTQGRSTEYAQGCSMSGIRLTQYGGGTHLYENNLYQNNYIIVKGQDGCENIRGTGISSDPNVVNLTVRNNTFKIVALDNNTALSSDWGGFGCFNIQGNSASSADHLPVLYLDNVCVSNVRFISFGESYGSGSNSYFKGNTFRKIGNHVNFAAVRLGFWIYPSFGHKIIDSVVEGGASLLDHYFQAQRDDLDYGVGHSLVVRVLHGSSPALGALVRFYDDEGIILDEGFVDGRGEYYYDVIEHHINVSGVFSVIPINMLVMHEGVSVVQKLAIQESSVIEVNTGGSCGSGDTRPCGIAVGECTVGVQHCLSGQWGFCEGSVVMSEEVCDGLDNDCNGLVDEGLGSLSCGLGVCAKTIPFCVGGVEQVCDPFLGQLLESSSLHCDNGIDENCDGFDQACLPVVEQWEDAHSFTCSVQDLHGVAEVQLLGMVGGSLQVLDSESFLSGFEYYFLEAEDFNRTSQWVVCPGPSCENEQWIDFPNSASGLSFVHGFRAEEEHFSALTQTGISPGEYYVWARSFQRTGNSHVRKWHFQSGSYVSGDFGDLNTGTFLWQDAGRFFINGTLRIVPSTNDYYVALPDLVVLTTDLDFDPVVDCGVDARNLLGHDGFPVRYSLGTCGLIDTERTVVFSRPIGVSGLSCGFIDGRGELLLNLELVEGFCGDGVCGVGEDFDLCPVDCPFSLSDFVAWSFSGLFDLIHIGKYFQ